ncbi:MAG: glutathione S-transferase family protein [Acidobacteriota bacterium]|nr:glutathione S-transferase family protein [Acidobacteriota bacterium]
MKLYDFPQAPNPRRVRIFLAEKGIEVPIVPVDIAAGENRKSPYIDKNPMGGVPMLELDDGTCVAESVAICRYFEALQPEPPLMGTDPQDQAVVEMWNRRMEYELAVPIMNAFRHTNDFFKGRITQVNEFGVVSKDNALKRMEWLDSVLSDREYIAGDNYTIADITALIGIDFGRVARIGIGDDQANLKRWHEAVSSRPSAKA